MVLLKGGGEGQQVALLPRDEVEHVEEVLLLLAQRPPIHVDGARAGLYALGEAANGGHNRVLALRVIAGAEDGAHSHRKVCCEIRKALERRIRRGRG